MNDVPILFFAAGARSRSQSPSIDAFRDALAAGATGLHATAWTTADGVTVLHEHSRLGGLRRRGISETDSASLPPAIPRLSELYGACEEPPHVVVDAANAHIAAAVRDAALAVSPQAATRLWIAHTDWEELARWRQRWGDVRLVNRSALRAFRQGPERRAAQLSEGGIDAVELPHTDWTGGLIALFHRFGRRAFASGAEHERVARELVRMGIDGMAGEHVERMVAAVNRRTV